MKPSRPIAFSFVSIFLVVMTIACSIASSVPTSNPAPIIPPSASTPG